MRKNIYIILSALLSLAFFVSPLHCALAAEPITFSDAPPTNSAMLALRYLQTHKDFASTAASPARHAQKDVNDDGINEHIFIENCNARPAICDAYIVAASGADITVLGTFKAGNIALSAHYTNGIRDILVYNTPKNDYLFTTMRWDSLHSQYNLPATDGTINASN